MVDIANLASNLGGRKRPRKGPDRGFPGETVKIFNPGGPAPAPRPPGIGARASRRAAPPARPGRGPMPQLPSSPAASAPGQRKKALGLRSARSLAPGQVRRAKAMGGPAQAPAPVNPAAVQSRRRAAPTLAPGSQRRRTAMQRVTPPPPPAPPSIGSRKSRAKPTRPTRRRFGR